VAVIAQPAGPGGQPRVLGTMDATVLVVANVVGVGIFLTPAGVAALARTPGWYFALWALGGAIALAGALSYAELGAALPEAGGEYVYLREAYGPLWAFLHVWSGFLVTFSGAIAAISVGAAEYGLRVLGLVPPGAPLPSGVVRVTALALVLSLTLLNCVGVKASSRFQNTLAGLTLGAMVLLVASGFAGGRGSAAHFAAPGGPPGTTATWAGLAAALVPIFFTYAGWNAPTYVAGEIARPGRAVPRALALGTGATIALYLALNALYVYAFPLDRLQHARSIGEAAATALIGPGAGSVVAGTITLITLGTLNVTILTGARIPFALGRSGAFLPFLGALHRRFATPARALAVQAAWAGALILTGTFESLVTFASLMMIVVSAMAVAGVFVLRARAPHLERPYRAWGYPVVPGLYVAACAGMAAGAIRQDPKASLAALGLLAAGAPVYRWRAARARRLGPAPAGRASE
jgi:basic amino acid/polyamine antiporter, APA family